VGSSRLAALSSSGGARYPVRREGELGLDTDLLDLDEKLNLEPVNYLVEPQDQQPCEVVVLSLVDTGQAKLSR
jgi:hypothetical protein